VCSAACLCLWRRTKRTTMQKPATQSPTIVTPVNALRAPGVIIPVTPSRAPKCAASPVRRPGVSPWIPLLRVVAARCSRRSSEARLAEAGLLSACTNWSAPRKVSPSSHQLARGFTSGPLHPMLALYLDEHLGPSLVTCSVHSDSFEASPVARSHTGVLGHHGRGSA